MEDNKIDFVVIWVDGNDLNWKKEKAKYDSASSSSDNREIRYRDWDNLQYWFRGVEKFAPWVNKIHFVTWGHVPKWLNTNHPKLNIVKHSDYIPSEYLPTFSSHTIELNIHRIKGLSEQFVYFNDDMFITDYVDKEDFFKRGKPCDSAILYPHISNRDIKNHAEVANMEIINDYFDKNDIIKKNIFKWFNIKYGVRIIQTICLLPWKKMPGILNCHLANSYNKSTFKILWEKEFHVLDETSKHKFRCAFDVNQWLMQDWQIASGNFFPRSINFGRNTALSDDLNSNEKVYRFIRNKKYKIICVNDMVHDVEKFDNINSNLINAFEYILNVKSKFEE